MASETEMSLDHVPQGQGLVKAAAVITALEGLNIVTGFALQVVFAERFGAGPEMDSYLVATTIPSLLRLVLIGSLNIAFVPVIVEFKTKKDESETWRLINGFFNLSALSLGALVVSGVIIAPLFIRLIAPGFQPGGQSFVLAVYVLRLLFPSILFNGLAGVLTGIYYAHEKFILPALVPVLNNLLILAVTLLFSSRLGVTAVALGTVAGSVAGFGLVYPIMLARGQYNLHLNPRHPGVRRVLTLIAPWVVGALIYKANPLIDRIVASHLPPGSISVLGYANQMLTVIVLLLSQGISTVLFPQLSKDAAAGKIQSLRTKASLGIRLIFFMAFPLSVGLAVLREPIIKLIFERGAFTPQATVDTGWALVGYSGALVVTSVGNVLTRVYYALQDTRTVAIVGTFGAGINLILALSLARCLGYLGPAVAYSLTAIFNFLILALLLRVRLGGLDGRKMWGTFYRVTLASFIVGGFLYALKAMAPKPSPGDVISQVIVLTWIAGTGAIVYIGLAFLFDMEEVQVLTRRLRGGI